MAVQRRSTNVHADASSWTRSPDPCPVFPFAYAQGVSASHVASEVGRPWPSGRSETVFVSVTVDFVDAELRLRILHSRFVEDVDLLRRFRCIDPEYPRGDNLASRLDDPPVPLVCELGIGPLSWWRLFIHQRLTVIDESD
jgi:hypothetical protein